jgi:inner membrane protein
MDSLTHIALGACMGEAFAGRTVGRKAMLWGALAQSIPDIDFLAAFWLDTVSNLLAHRGFTHSLLFCLIIALLFSYLAERWHRPHNISYRRWLAFFASVIFVHLFIDAFNNYGVGWFEPFSHSRVSFNAIYVADPFFSIWPGIAFAALILLRRRHAARSFWWKFGLIMSFLYLSYSLVNKMTINRQVKRILAKQNIQYKRYFTTPAPFQNWLWFVVAGDEKGYYTGYCSVFDSKDSISLRYSAVNDSLLQPFDSNPDLAKLRRFSQGYYTAERYANTVVFNDLRFGQVIGWHNPAERFAFYYYLQYPQENALVVQRGRFAKWDAAVIKSLWNRIRGN